MTQADDLQRLVERIEAAKSDDPELFWEAQRIVNPEPSTIWKNEQREVWTPEYAAYIALGHRFGELIDAGAYLDAAMTLVDPRALWAHGSMEDGPFARLCWPQPDGTFSGGYVEAHCNTVPLSIVCAALRARITQENSNDPSSNG